MIMFNVTCCKPSMTKTFTSRIRDQVLLAHLPISSAVDFVDCGSGNVRQLVIGGCESGAQCYVPRGKELTFGAQFVSGQKYEQVNTYLSARVGFVNLPNLVGEAGLDSDACLNYLQCPLEPQSNYQINTTFVIPNKTPNFGNIRITVKLLSPSQESSWLGKKKDIVVACAQTKISLL